MSGLDTWRPRHRAGGCPCVQAAAAGEKMQKRMRGEREAVLGIQQGERQAEGGAARRIGTRMLGQAGAGGPAVAAGVGASAAPPPS